MVGVWEISARQWWMEGESRQRRGQFAKWTTEIRQIQGGIEVTTGLSRPWNFGRREKGDGRNSGGTAGQRKSGGGVLGSSGVNCGKGGTAGRCRNSAEERQIEALWSRGTRGVRDSISRQGEGKTIGLPGGES